MTNILQQPWEHPDWYDLHDNTAIAGPEREPEHYREFVLTLPPLGVICLKHRRQTKPPLELDAIAMPFEELEELTV